jgi:phenylpropionate dioxygenase-like ring-hydroxylating dioxygenase large terminal subunit
MLSENDNELLCRVGPGTPVGDLMRRYWIPAIRSEELPSPDSPPLRVRLLGEDLIGFRTTSGVVGLVQNACPHRGASMFFGRNEEEGLRCVYHGWKFDITGTCVDMPSEPVESNFKTKVHTRAYECRERGDVIWAWMGEQGKAPELPMLEGNMQPEGESFIYNLFCEGNFMQNWEGDMDTVHAAFLHGSFTPRQDLDPTSVQFFVEQNKAPRFSVLDTEWGTSYGAYRPAGDDSYYWRISHMLFPFYSMIPFGTLGDSVFWRGYVPIDDSHTMMWTQIAGTSFRDRIDGLTGGLHWLPSTSGWLGRYHLTQNQHNDFLIDRELQKTGTSYTGIPGGARPQDMAMTWSMGAIYDRSHEHLGTTDALIIRTRRRMINAARALRANGTPPPASTDAAIYAQRSGQTILPRNVDWWEETRELRKGFVKHDGLKQLAGGG